MRISSLVGTAAAVLALATFAPSVASAAPFTVVATASGPAIAGPGVALSDFDVFFEFDPAVTVQAVTFGNQLNLGNPAGSLQIEEEGTAGVLEVLEVSFLDFSTLMTAQPDAFTLFTVMFDSGALTPAAALASLHIGSVTLGDTLGNLLDPSVVTFTGRLPGTVPEPASALLLVAGLGSVLARMRRRDDRR